MLWTVGQVDVTVQGGYGALRQITEQGLDVSQPYLYLVDLAFAVSD